MNLAEEHEITVARIRAYLFYQRPPEDFGIKIETEQIILPSPGNLVIRPSFGGISYDLSTPRKPVRLSIQHWDRDSFRVRTVVVGEFQTSYTINAIDCDLTEIRETVLRAWANAKDS